MSRTQTSFIIISNKGGLPLRRGKVTESPGSRGSRGGARGGKRRTVPSLAESPLRKSGWRGEYPARHESAKGRPMRSNISCCVTSEPAAKSKVNTLWLWPVKDDLHHRRRER